MPNDAFPLDPAASQDRDGDGYPDAWNPGYGPEDSTEGLVLDAFPDDSACQLAEHARPGQPGICDIARAIPVYTPSRIEVDTAGTLYLLSPENDRIYRWSLGQDYHLNPIDVGDDPQHFAYSAQNNRLYVSYASGAITQIDLAAPSLVEQPFATLSQPVYGLQTAGRYLVVAQTYYSQYTYAPDGTRVGQHSSYSSANLEWSAANSRMYYTRDGISPNDLHWEGINPATGAFTGSGETPYHGAYAITPPIRASRNGAYVLLGSGDLYNGTTLQIVDSLPISLKDALWLADGSLVTIRSDGGRTLLEHWGADRRRYNYGYYDGEPLRVVESQGEIAVVTRVAGRPIFQAYVPTDDADADGVTNADDAFPLDPAASQDRDGDGHPDAWNPGYGPEDSTEGLVLDAFPDDSACHLAEHARPGQPGVCDIARAVPVYTPARIEVDTAGTLYLLSPENDRIYRWSLGQDYHLNPIDVGDDPRHIAYSAQNNRLYVGYANGAITQIDLAASSLVEQPFATTPGAVTGLHTAGRYVFAVDPSGAWNSHYTFAPNGTRISAVEWNYYSLSFDWSPVNNRIYFARDDTSPNDLHWETIDPATGQITGEGESPYHGDFPIQHPIRVSRDAAYVLLGSGDLFDGTTLQAVNSLPITLKDALWLADGSLVTIRSDGGRTMLEHWGGDLRRHNYGYYDGEPLRVIESQGEIAVVTRVAGRPIFHSYVPSDDADADGVTNAEDAFPLDPAASEDRDGDGHPGSWNPGYGPEDSTEGLVLDAFPDDSACHLAEHARPGQPGVCDIARAIPVYTPARIEVDTAGHALPAEPRERPHLPLVARPGLPPEPDPLGDNPRHIAYSAQNGRLYVGYANGAITQIDLGAPSLVEQPFATLSEPIRGLQTAGRYVVASQYSSMFTYAPSGTRVGENLGYYGAANLEWSGANSRIYYTRDGTSPNDIHWEAINPATGAFTSFGESPYHGDFSIQQPIRASRDGAYVLLGSGDYYDGQTLEISGSLPHTLKDALWTQDGLIAIRTDGAGGTWLEQWSSDFRLYNQARYAGEPLRIVESQGEIALVTRVAGRPVFQTYTPTDDGDGDGVRNPDDAFPLDPAASEDSDSDGYPDAWNPGYGPGDSTEGLLLDAFPDDFACQTPEHGVGGVCDFAYVLPASVDEPFCDTDDVLPTASSGFLTLPSTSDFVPLCNGWLLIGDVANDRIAVHNPANQRTGAIFPLPSAPGDLELDEQRKLLYVALPEQLALAELDLLTGDVHVIPVSGAISSLSMGPDGGLLIAVRNNYAARLYWLAPEAATPIGPWNVNGTLIRWNPVFEELAVADQGLSPARLSRYSFDSTLGVSLLQTTLNAGSNGQDLALSGDGLHLAYATGSGQGSYSIYDYVPTNLTSYRGAWPIGAYPSGVSFDRASHACSPPTATPR